MSEKNRIKKIRQEDKNFGNLYEDLLFKYFKEHPEIHGVNLRRTINRFNVVDYVNDKWVCELKSRRFSIKSFDNWMVGENKMREAESEYSKGGRNFRFYFTLNEGVYYWDYEPNPESDDEEMKYYYDMGGRQDRGKDERKPCAYIFSDNLKLLTNSIHT